MDYKKENVDKDTIMTNSTTNIKKSLVKLNLAYQGNTLRYLKQLKNWQWLDKDQSDALQHQANKRLVIHAYNHVPYYRKVFESAGVVTASGSVNLEYFSKIPLLDKAKIRSNFEDLKSDDLHMRKWNKNSSGGSTGEPVTLIQDNVYADWKGAVKILYDSWTECSIAGKKICLWGSERDIFMGRETSKTRLMQWLNNHVWLNAFRMTPDEMHSYVRTINDVKPVQILSYVESIFDLSRFIEREGLSVYSPRSIMTTAGPLSQHIRDTVGRVFKAPLFNRYGSREVGDMACECDAHTGLHVSLPTHYVEVLRSDGTPTDPGEVGQIVITCLSNYAMPLIRYCIGDMGKWADHSCSCGRSWPLLKEIVGRETDIFLKDDGSRIHGEYFTHLFYYQDWVEKFQVVQEDYQNLCVKIVPREQCINPLELYAQHIEEISDKMKLVMGQKCNVNFEFLDDIVPTASGKYRYTISMIDR